jgi:hypothetical protein
MALEQIIRGKPTLEGCIHFKWQDIFQLYISSLGRKHDRKRFVTVLIKLLWQTSYMWDNRNSALHNMEINDALK